MLTSFSDMLVTVSGQYANRKKFYKIDVLEFKFLD